MTKSKVTLKFVQPFLRVTCLYAPGVALDIDRLPDLERAKIELSQTAGARCLALKDSGYNRSAAQTRGKNGFDKYQFAFRAWKYLPAIRGEIIAAMERNDLDYFVRLGKTVEALKKQPACGEFSNEVDPLGHFLVTHWIAQRGANRVPSFCLLSAQVLHELCEHCRTEDSAKKFTVKDIEKKIERLGLERSKSFRLSNCGRNGKMLFVAEGKQLLTTHGRDRNRKIDLVV